MTLTEEQIEWIVAEVIHRLGVAPKCGSVDSTSNADLRISERVVTLRTIEKRLSGVKRVVVPLKAVVTPAAKDELKSKKIELVFDK